MALLKTITTAYRRRYITHAGYPEEFDNVEKYIIDIFSKQKLADYVENGTTIDPRHAAKFARRAEKDEFHDLFDMLYDFILNKISQIIPPVIAHRIYDEMNYDIRQLY